MSAARRVVLLSVAAFGCWLLGPSAAAANVTISQNFSSDFTFTSDGASDSITITCQGGLVHYVEGNTSPQSLPCGNLVDLTLVGGGGNDSLNVSALTPDVFTKLHSPTLDASAGKRHRPVSGSGLGDVITASDNDAVTGNAGDDDITGGNQVNGGDGDDLLFATRGPGDGGRGDDRIEQPGSTAPYAGGPGYDTVSLDLGFFDEQVPPIAADFTITITDTAVGFTVTSPAAITAQTSLSSFERADLTATNLGDPDDRWHRLQWRPPCRWARRARHPARWVGRGLPQRRRG